MADESLNLRKVMAITDSINECISRYDRGDHLTVEVIKRFMQKISSKHNLPTIPKMVDLISAMPENYKPKLLPILKTKPVRTASGIAVVAVMSKPHRCPHIATTGNICIYCPGGPDSDFEYSTQSYTGYEPTSMRAIRARYNPYIQVKDRTEQLKRIGHDVDKVEFIIMGGTFMSLDAEYRDYFVRNLHDALSGHISKNIKESVQYSEQGRAKCIGITIETRPDFCQPPHIRDMLSYGCTRLEVGVQSIYEDIAKDTNRGHTVAAVKKCFEVAKDAGYKVVSHMMPDLPNMGVERDLESFKEFFENPDFRPDGLKIYPTMVIRGTQLYEMWKKGVYKNYSPQFLVEVIAKVLALVPPWVRVYRIQRDIPMPLVTSGVDNGNLRELALKKMKEMNLVCRDVRTREVGIKEAAEKIEVNDVELIRRDYFANGSWETFLSYEDPQTDSLVGMLRLRKLGDKRFMSELKGATAMVRELHVYGSVVPVHSKDPKKFQHQGYGRLLMEEAERVAVEEYGCTRMAVISGVGTRHYYRKMGYHLDGPYMVKMLSE